MQRHRAGTWPSGRSGGGGKAAFSLGFAHPALRFAICLTCLEVLPMMHASAAAAGLSKAVGAAPPSVLLAAGLELALLLTHAQVWGGFE